MILRETQKALSAIGNTVFLAGETFKYVPSVPRQLDRIVDQAFNMGYRTFPIVGILSFFIGAVLALQSGYSLKELSGAQVFLGNIVGLSMSKELGPVMTAFLLAGRVGSAIAAELAAMRVYQEIDALKTHAYFSGKNTCAASGCCNFFDDACFNYVFSHHWLVWGGCCV